MKEIKCNVQMYFVVPDGMTPKEYKTYLTNMTMLDMVRQFNEAYATDWESSSDDNDWDRV